MSKNFLKMLFWEAKPTRYVHTTGAWETSRPMSSSESCKILIFSVLKKSASNTFASTSTWRASQSHSSDHDTFLLHSSYSSSISSIMASTGSISGTTPRTTWQKTTVNTTFRDVSRRMSHSLRSCHSSMELPTYTDVSGVPGSRELLDTRGGVPARRVMASSSSGVSPMVTGTWTTIKALDLAPIFAIPSCGVRSMGFLKVEIPRDIPVRSGTPSSSTDGSSRDALSQ
mmetsp:Transcript_48281/g.127827  ORF Transcript_48281/g.127827 Transcript_48281/m.127827 type:complete len:228 (+) Transcript_48281:252-935(+)